MLVAGGIVDEGKWSLEDPATSDSVDVANGWFPAGGKDIANSAGSIARREGSIANSEGSRAGSCEVSRAGSSEDELAGNKSGKKEELDEGSSGCGSDDDDDAKMASKSPAGMSFNNASNSSRSELPGTLVLVFWPSGDIGGNIDGRKSAPVVGGVFGLAVSATISFLVESVPRSCDAGKLDPSSSVPCTTFGTGATDPSSGADASMVV